MIPVLGNHDFKQAFYRGYLGEERTGSYTARYELADTAFWYWIRPRRATAAA